MVTWHVVAHGASGWHRWHGCGGSSQIYGRTNRIADRDTDRRLAFLLGDVRRIVPTYGGGKARADKHPCAEFNRVQTSAAHIVDPVALFRLIIGPCFHHDHPFAIGQKWNASGVFRQILGFQHRIRAADL